MRASSRRFSPVIVASLMALAAPLAAAQGRQANPCDGAGGSQGGRATHCEVREQTVAFPGQLNVDAGPNGGVAVHGWNRGDVSIKAKVVATADTEAAARALAGQVQVLAEGGRIRSQGPRIEDGSGWSVSFDLMVPMQAALDLRTTNGGISIENVQGELTFRTTNGGITLKNVNGNVRGATSNGGVHVDLDGSGWIGEGLDVETRNGGVRLAVPEGYSAHLEAGTNNGGLSANFPVTTEGEWRRAVNTDLGSGGAPLRLRTVNGGISISRR